MVTIVANSREGRLPRSAAELVAAAAALGGQVRGVVTGEGSAEAAAELSRYLPEVTALTGELATAEAATAALRAALAGTEVVLISADRWGQAVAPRLAVSTGAALLEDVTSLERAGDAVRATRLAYLSRVTETVEAAVGSVVVTVKPNALTPAQPSASQGTVATVAVPQDAAAAAHGKTVLGRTAARGAAVPLEEARVVVAGGRGLGTPERFAALVEPMAAALGGAVAATRAVVDAGWRPYSEQVGQTGKAVTPELYVALGISGAVQHLSGMNRSKVIVAVNRDADAPIFRVSDYGIVGDLNEVGPALLSAVKETMSS